MAICFDYHSRWWFKVTYRVTTTSPRIRPLSLTDAQKSDLVQFLRSLSGPPNPETLPVLPR